ncbi:hypothetical protein M441DRAFT_245894 [Trichoderma asperellum CBS 433.97]|uniref:Uncharacterized protein n=1 Tax=Trichoderma asperellum (strain ATCC 204424 / CBS 433.97 / NBRC 101777) TaxID=1042311 RepID=A0A2T3YZP8_TRIA4|nr:hypothetical protein M441DRAFT_245894 [Trichoderma asperellum CBS 433.97]PTB38051.1 hypothetical protein M441DRAFT_245894 [Trichoderma asperellum CBS 433.97]
MQGVVRMLKPPCIICYLLWAWTLAPTHLRCHAGVSSIQPILVLYLILSKSRPNSYLITAACIQSQSPSTEEKKEEKNGSPFPISDHL